MKVKSKWLSCFCYDGPRNEIVEIEAELPPDDPRKGKFVVAKVTQKYRLKDGAFHLLSASDEEREELKRRAFRHVKEL